MVKEFHSDYRVSGRMRRVIAAREWEEEEEEEVGSEWEWERVACLLGFVGMRVHVCTLGSARWVYACWHLVLTLPRCSHCGELSACLDRSLPLPLFLFIPSLYLLSSLCLSPPSLFPAPLRVLTASSFCSGPPPPCCGIFIDWPDMRSTD